MTESPRPPAGTRAGSWFDDRFRLGGASASLYCFPFAGGTAGYYAPWAPRFHDTVELVPVQLPGRGPRMAEPGPTDMAELADEIAALIARAPTRPLLFGHSMGAIIAFEVARRLERLGGPADFLFVSGRPAPPIHRPRTRFSTLPRAEFVQVLRDYGAASEEILAHDELLDVLIPMMRADFALIEGYTYTPGPALSCPVLAWCGDADPEVEAEEMRRWGEMTSERFELFVRPGGHFFLTDHRAEVATTIQQSVTV
ncbi:thioesterase II family protein [Streptomyces sp. NPDC092903]|uniref:thioesterase II family protein n=1 Tax=Streptomyces sp. NPDC092903 TaxID=3366017 RepID=UPI00382E69C2